MNYKYFKYTLLSFIVFCWQWSVAQEDMPVQFKRISIEEGLSSSTASCVLKDHKGFLWIGTAKGLNRYDGITFKTWRSAVYQRHVTCLEQDSNNRIFVGTGFGLAIYNYERDNYEYHFPNKKNTYADKRQNITTIYSDSKNNTWIAAYKGLSRYINENGNIRFKQYRFIKNNKQVTPAYISSILEDKYGNLLVFTVAGIWYQKKGSNKFLPCTLSNLENKNQNVINEAILDINGDILIATNAGLLKIESDSSLFPVLNTINILKGTNYEFSSIKNVAQDKENLIWFNLYDKGLFTLRHSIYGENKTHIKNYRYSSINKFSLSSNRVSNIYCDNDDILWISTDGGGLCKYNKHSLIFSTIIHDENKPGTIPYGKVSNLLVDKYGTFWVVIQDRQLYIKRKHEDGFSKVENNLLQNVLISDIKNFTDNEILVASRNDKYGGLLKITQTSKFNKTGNPGFLKIENLSEQFIPDDSKKGIEILVVDSTTVYYTSDQKGLYKLYFSDGTILNVENIEHPNNIHCLTSDKNGNIWFGSNNFFFFNPQNSRIKKVRNNRPQDLLVDYTGNIWIATQNHGVIQYNPITEESELVRKVRGLSSNFTVSLAKDNYGSIWVGTLNGLCAIDTANLRVNPFTNNDGIVNLEYAVGSVCTDSTGNIYFGGKKGIDYFNPKNFHTKEVSQSNIQFTSLVVNGKFVEADTSETNPIIDKELSLVDKIILQPSHEQFTISFADLNYTIEREKNYRYKIDEIEKYWHYCSENNAYASYGKLKSGTYTLLVASTNKKRYWNQKPKRLIIHVEPKLTETLAFKIGVVLIGLLLIYLVFLFRLQMLRNQKKTLEKKVNERTRELQIANKEIALQKEETIKRKEDLHQSKLRFFTNISHEFRTPITLMKGAVDQVEDSNFNQEILKKYLPIFKKNNTILLNLVNEIMDFRKMETGHMRLSAQELDTKIILQDIIDVFENAMADKNINFSYNLANNCLLWLDKAKFSKIIFNLISNSLKYTNPGGSVEIILSNNPKSINPKLTNNISILANEKPLTDYIEISIEDSGIGMSENSVQEIFDRFQQIDNQLNEVGSGIGLALTKQLILLHRADVFVSSSPNIGTRFTLHFPTGKSHLKPEEKIKDSIEENENTLKTKSNVIKEEIQVDKNIHLLLVEDNDDLRLYLNDIFSEYYSVIEASDGKEGLTIAQNKIPDIILSDVMMPHMTGTELCQHIKSNIATCHIPIILLTAKTSIENQLAGLKTGADLYLPKPFNKQMLLFQVNNILTTRINYTSKIKNEELYIPADISTNKLDIDFIEKTTEIIKKELINTSLSIEDLAKEIGFSYKTFQRKLKALTGYKPSDFIRIIRLNTAKELLINTSLSITEIAFKAGFYDVSHFGRLFKEKFQLTPKEFRQNHSSQH